MSYFAENLRKAIFDKRIKAVDVANATKITPSVISRYLTGAHQPSTDNLLAISKYLEISPEALLSSSDAPESSGSSKYISSDKDKIIAVQEELIEHLQKRVKELEEALGKKITPVEENREIDYSAIVKVDQKKIKEFQERIKELEKQLEMTTKLKNDLLEKLYPTGSS